MKVFTKELYKGMTTISFLVFPETIEEWEESVQMYKTNGIDFQQICKEELEERKPDLLKFLPKSFHSYINAYATTKGELS